ncbi:e092c658-de24-4188-82ae-46162015b279 [Thermothielavioides terrestris]|uniref:E092c658-de24-4188-82ae-46162015b279 n=1 Tax=Thermothielavioides terrestris TaxID=2587410 RepID=A0A3S4BBH4_9PEZI|nr:e092c658-de24-4188-82ae-46162015b279 [Thermothielavioides terrestris]
MVDQSGRLGRRRPFSALMKKLANLKATSSGEGGRYHGSKRGGTKKRLNNPYPQSGRIAAVTSPRHSHYSVSSGPSRRLASVTSLEQVDSARISGDERPPPTTGGRSMAPTVSTEHETCRSIAAPSHGESSLGGISRTANGRRGGDSTFSSPAPSVRSLTTTLTTIQTVAPNGGGSNPTPPTTNHHHSHNSTSQVIHFNQPFPTTSSSPASAIPAHLATTTTTTTTSFFHPTTYATATANNLLTDNASILTLASSSARRRRRSLDTDASVRALAPSSLWGGSRESLPLSVLSATMDGPPTTPGLHRGAGAAAAAGATAASTERASIYSATGILLQAAASERSSFYAGAAAAAKQQQQLGQQGQGLDAASVRSGLFGHARADSVTGSISGGAGLGGSASAAAAGAAAGTSPLTSPREVDGEGEAAGVVEKVGHVEKE